MPKNPPELPATPAQAPILPEKARRRRTEQEMQRALTRIDQLRSVIHLYHDDEHNEVLHDVVSEVLALRKITAMLVQDVTAASLTAQAELKNITNP